MFKNTLIVASSSGIDSTTCLIILKKKKFYIESLFIKNWENKTECKNKKDFIHVKIICKKYKIKLTIIDTTKKYWSLVFSDFIKNLKKGNTPNPDIICNEKIKFKEVINKIKNKLNFNYLITGHYAEVKKNNHITLNESKNKIKDQTFFLTKIKKNILNKIIFPITNYKKLQIKKFLKNEKIINVNKKNSTGICFIENNKYKNFINKYIKIKKGEILTYNKEKIGYHNGIHNYTIGEKIKNNLIVIKKDIIKNIIYVEKNFLFKNRIKVSKKNLINKLEKKIYQIKLRHQGKKIKCIINKKKKEIFLKKKTIIPDYGQLATMYINSKCIGFIEIKSDK